MFSERPFCDHPCEDYLLYGPHSDCYCVRLSDARAALVYDDDRTADDAEEDEDTTDDG